MEARVKLIPKYKPLFENNTRYFVLTSGRGAGKSFHVADFLLKLTYEVGHTILYTRYTMVSAHISIIPEFTQRIEDYGLGHMFEVTQNEIINKQTKSNILFKGIKTSSGNNTAALKSIANVTTLVIEEGEDLQDENVFDTIDLSVRHKTLQNRILYIMNPSNKQHWAYKRWFEKVNIPTNFNGINDGVTYIFTSYLDNENNLPASFLEQAQRMKTQNEPRYRHLFLGEWIDEAQGILWNRNQVNASRIKTAPENIRVVVAIDPATTANANSDETGIIVVGKSGDKLYILDDLSGRYTPEQWAKVAHKALLNYNADYYVAEQNQGGLMVKSVIANQDPNNRVKLVTATKGKFVRAEPIYQLYEMGKVFHVGEFPILENQMVTFNPDSNQKSPDRVDALVWGCTEFSNNPTNELFLY